jgi:oxysterol-binding protein-related protein 3/6/7
MLAETFEDVRMKYIAEKVRHHPFAMAYHAEGEGWELYATSAGKTKFWGSSKLGYIREIITNLQIL